jgi:hypothetical protein
MVSGFRGIMAAASTIATCKTQQIGLTNIALPQFPQPRQIFQKRPLPVGPALPGPNYTSNLAHLAGIPLPMPAVSMARQQGVLTQALPTFEEIGDSRHQGRGQKLRHSGRRGGSLKPNRTFVTTRTPMTNRSRGNCKRTEVRSLLTPISCLGLSTWLGAFPPDTRLGTKFWEAVPLPFSTENFQLGSEQVAKHQQVLVMQHSYADCAG